MEAYGYTIMPIRGPIPKDALNTLPSKPEDNICNQMIPLEGITVEKNRLARHYYFVVTATFLSEPVKKRYRKKIIL